MAVQDAILIPGQDPAIQINNLAATTSSTEQNLGKNKLFSIVATGDFTIRFGRIGMGAAVATDFLIPANAIVVFDTGNPFTHIRVFNLGASTIDVHILGLSRF